MSLAEKQQKLFLGEDPDNEPEDAEDSESPLPNLMELVFFFEQAGIGLAREEMFRLVYQVWEEMIRSEQSLVSISGQARKN